MSVNGVAEKLEQLIDSYKKGEIPTAAPILPFLFFLRNKPYTLHNHFVFEELYSLRQPTRTVLMTGRQIGKTTNIAVHSLLLAATNPYMTIVAAAPLGEQIGRFSTMYINPLLLESPIRSILVGRNTINRVLQKEFKNGSRIVCTFAFLDPTRTRGIPGSRLVVDEAQSMDISFLPILREIISQSEFGQQEMYSGTPLTEDNTLAYLWSESSQAEWFIPCSHCTTNGFPTWNIPSPDYHLDKIIGPVHESISERIPATICYKCRKPISPRMGRWVHRYPERRWSAAGYHIPQIIIPYHYANPKHWSLLYGKYKGLGPTPINKFYNEVLGWPYELSDALLGLSDLKKVCCLPKNTEENAISQLSKYELVSLGVDWGGGGADGVSLTTLALCGLTHTKKVEVIWGTKLLNPLDPIKEAEIILYYLSKFQPHFIAHDYNGAGSIRETLLLQAGVEPSKIKGMVYSGARRTSIITYHAATPTHPREYYLIDKTKSLQMLCNLIRLGGIRFFEYDFVSNEEPGLVHEFLGLREEKYETANREIYRITHRANQSCDFVDAVNYGWLALWYVAKTINCDGEFQLERSVGDRVL